MRIHVDENAPPRFRLQSPGMMSAPHSSFAEGASRTENLSGLGETYSRPLLSSARQFGNIDTDDKLAKGSRSPAILRRRFSVDLVDGRESAGFSAKIAPGPRSSASLSYYVRRMT